MYLLQPTLPPNMRDYVNNGSLSVRKKAWNYCLLLFKIQVEVYFIESIVPTMNYVYTFIYD